MQWDVGAGRLTAKGCGQAMPTADNRTEEGRAEDRRVDRVEKQPAAIRHQSSR